MNEMDEVVSIIVPVYKTEKYLSKCVNSIINQTYKNLEIILVDDGSPDKSGQICDEFTLVDSRIKVIHKKNGGLSDARNVGLSLAAGKYVLFCDSDDWIEPDIVNLAVKEMDVSKAELVIWGYSADFVDSNENIISSSICMANEKICVGNSEGLEHKNVIGLLGYAWNKLYRRSLIYEHGLQFEKGVSLVEDILFNAQVINHCNILSIFDCVGTHYIQRNNVTLGKAIYTNYMELIYRAIEAKRSILFHFQYDIKKSKIIISRQIINALKTGVLNIAYNRDMSFKNQKHLIKDMLDDKYFKMLMAQCKASSIKDFIFIYMLKTKAIGLLLLYSKARI